MKKHQKKTEEPASGYKYLQQIVSSVSPPLLTTAQLQGQKITINPNVHDDRHGVVWEDDFGETEEQNKPKKKVHFLLWHTDVLFSDDEYLHCCPFRSLFLAGGGEFIE